MWHRASGESRLEVSGRDGMIAENDTGVEILAGSGPVSLPCNMMKKHIKA